MKGGGVFTLRSFHTSGVPQPDLSLFTCPNCSNKVDKDRTYELKYKQILPNFKSKDGVPGIFLEYYPKISVSDYKLIKNDTQFLERRARVCDVCYIGFTQFNQNGTKSKSLTSPPKSLTRTLSNGNSVTTPATPLSRSDSSSRYSAGSTSSSPPSSPLYTSSPKSQMFKSTPPPPKKSPSTSPISTLSSSSTSPASISNSHSPSHPLSHSGHSTLSHSSKPTKQNGQYKDSYYLNLYEELDSLRKEINELRANEGNSVDELNQQLKEKDEELRVQKKVYANKNRQDSQQKDQQIKDLQSAISNLQTEHSTNLESIEREFEKKLELKVENFESEKAKMQATINHLQKEIEQVKQNSDQKLSTDRSEVLTEVEKLKKKFDMEKMVEKEQITKKYRDDVEFVKKKSEERVTELGAQINDLKEELAQEKRGREKEREERENMVRTIESLKAKNRVG